MALQKIKKIKNGALENGISGNYWKPNEYVFDDNNGTGYIIMALYKDKATRDNPEMTYLEAITQIPFVLNKEEMNNNFFNFIYTKIKENEYFSDAIDLLD